MDSMVQRLHKELQTVIQELPEFTNSGFCVFDIGDVEAQIEHTNVLPAACVMYEGGQAVDGTKGNSATPTSSHSGGAILIEAQFSVIIALQYGFVGQGEDTKWSAFSLLDAVRSKLLGYQGVNSRPWRYIGERPEIPASTDGLVFYSQVWRTYVPSRGTFKQV